ncbi:hypothetical protein [Kitasatospora sp. NPDC001527]|uniref:hypothetical protein n=1 Tax=Kitasatospora sp. NPDC001527 TaxID=3154519 RepID=UPI00331CE78C
MRDGAIDARHLDAAVSLTVRTHEGGGTCVRAAGGATGFTVRSNPVGPLKGFLAVIGLLLQRSSSV